MSPLANSPHPSGTWKPLRPRPWLLVASGILLAVWLMFLLALGIREHRRQDQSNSSSQSRISFSYSLARSPLTNWR